ncbi:hypothetical protein JCGZ_25396 [Jatropha curcas]|uniref:Uncharacterized protein n=1 Tax=Jatropha curcas TaxID=180498 RepID=A0A067JLP9_JATCU|nr:hypothetical protein JCGZ_25396 [Jatropha curcas]
MENTVPIRMKSQLHTPLLCLPEITEEKERTAESRGDVEKVRMIRLASSGRKIEEWGREELLSLGTSREEKENGIKKYFAIF